MEELIYKIAGLFLLYGMLIGGAIVAVIALIAWLVG